MTTREQIEAEFRNAYDAARVARAEAIVAVDAAYDAALDAADVARDRALAELESEK